jgi:hypothetical protein
MFSSQMGHLMPITYLPPTSHLLLQPTYLPSKMYYLPTNPPTYLDVIPTSTPIHPPTYLPTIPPTYLPSYLIVL